MRKLILMFGLAACACAQVTITGTIRDARNVVWSGRIQPKAIAVTPSAYGPTVMAPIVVTNGVLSTTLNPGTYSVTYTDAVGRAFRTATWTVPGSGPVVFSDIESGASTSPIYPFAYTLIAGLGKGDMLVGGASGIARMAAPADGTYNMHWASGVPTWSVGGSAAALDVGTAAGTVAAGDDARFSNVLRPDSNGNVKVGTTVLPGYNIAAWGDSLVGATTGQVPFTEPLATALNRSVFNGGFGGQTCETIKGYMLVATDKLADYTVIWAGQNNTADNFATVPACIAGMVAALQPPKRYLVVGMVPNAGWSAGLLAAMTATNATLAAAYPTNFWNALAYLQTQGNNGTNDNADIAAGLTPRSLRAPADNIHLTTAANALVATQVGNWITAHDSLPQYVPNVSSIPGMFASPAPIGGTVPATGTFKAISVYGTDLSTGIGDSTVGLRIWNKHGFGGHMAIPFYGVVGPSNPAFRFAAIDAYLTAEDGGIGAAGVICIATKAAMTDTTLTARQCWTASGRSLLGGATDDGSNTLQTVGGFSADKTTTSLPSGYYADDGSKLIHTVLYGGGALRRDFMGSAWQYHIQNNHFSAPAEIVLGGVSGGGGVSILAGANNQNIDLVPSGAGAVVIASGTNAVYRCSVAGTLRAGQMTTVSADCGTAVDTGIRVK